MQLRRIRPDEHAAAGDVCVAAYDPLLTGAEDDYRDRLHDVLTACRQRPCSAADMLPILFQRHLDLHQTTFAMGEAVAHLNHLWHLGQLRRGQDSDGVWRFEAA